MMRHMMRQGSGWSGHERHCVYLNTGDSRFANISATSGMDFDDDGRGIGVVDWDLDGDLDLWISNRSGPRLRFMRNDNATGHRYVAVRLRGRKSNRDGIGARIEVHPTGGGRKLVKTVHAGSGFLAESSRWTHFGLGAVSGVDRIVVHWPGATAEEFGALEADGFYRLVQDSGAAERRTVPQRELVLTASTRTAKADVDAARAFLGTRVPAPDVRFADFSGQERAIAEFRGKPLLLNLWASWCSPCQRELRDFGARQQELRDSGLQVVAVSLDGVGGDTQGTPDKARELLAKLAFPFASGVGRSEMLDMVELLHGAMLYPLRPFPIPTSLLIDAAGWVAAIYQGPVPVDDLIADVKKLDTPANQLRQVAVPFAGRWTTEPRFFDYLTSMGLDFLDAGYPQYAETHYRMLLGRDPEHAEWRNNLGLVLAAQGKLAEAESEYRRALHTAPRRAALHVNLGEALLRQGKQAAASAEFEEAVRLEPRNPDARGSLGLTYVADGRTRDAVEHLRAALAARPAWPQVAGTLARILATHSDASLGTPQEAVQLAEHACQLTDYTDARFLDVLGIAYARAGRFEDAVRAAENAVRLARASGQQDLASDLEARLMVYRDGRSDRDVEASPSQP